MIKRIGETVFCVSALLAAGLSTWAQLAIDWHTIDGGGGTSTGGVYSVSGTVGQYDANTVQMAGGSFTLDGGFWAVFAVQMPGAPFLSIISAGPGQAMISWTPATAGWILQESDSLAIANWIDSPSMSTNPVVVPTTLPTTFYRLVKP